MEHVAGAVGALVVARGLEVGLGRGLVVAGAGVTGLGLDDVTAGRVLVPGVPAGVVGRAVLVGTGVATDVETDAVADVSEGVACGSAPWHAARVSATATPTAPAQARVLRCPRRPMTPPTSMEHP
jgi:tryptophan synthase alpha subunit